MRLSVFAVLLCACALHVITAARDEGRRRRKTQATGGGSSNRTSGPHVGSRSVSSLLYRLLRKYDKAIRPKYDRSAVRVNVSLHVLSVKPNPADGEIGVSMYVRQRWSDPRLRFPRDPFRSIRADVLERIWTPDLFFPDLVEGKVLMEPVPNRQLDIHNNGDVSYIYKFVGTFRCPAFDTMHHKTNRGRPLTCDVTLDSFGYTTADVLLAWRASTPLEMERSTVMAGGGWAMEDARALVYESLESGGDKRLTVQFTLERR